MLNKWISVQERLPKENEIVYTKIDDEKGIRNETKLIRKGNLWFLPDKSMYVYYIPTHWKPLSNDLKSLLKILGIERW